MANPFVYIEKVRKLFEVGAMFPIFLLGLVIVGLVSSIRSLFITKYSRNQSISLENVILHLLIYITVLMGFGLLYMVLDVTGHPVLIENGQVLQGNYFEKIASSMYFSAITLLSVGYGDITPIGIGRWLAIVEALLGYTIPVAFVVRMVINIERS